MRTSGDRDDREVRAFPQFDAELLREIAGDTIFERGADYHSDGRVTIMAVDAARVRAIVRGSERYRATVTLEDGEISGHCTCPAFAEMAFCKHLVAAALAANDVTGEGRQQIAGRLAPIRNHLRAQSVEALSELILELAEREPALMHRLELAAAADAPDDESLYARFTAALAEATRIDDYLSYQEARAWVEELEEVLDQVERMIDRGRAGVVQRIVEDLFVRLDEALLSADDSSGSIGSVYCRACDIHRRACDKAKPDPVELARELFERETGSDWDFFDGASESYADALGDAGLAEYRRLAEEAWSGIAPRRGDKRDTDESFVDRYQLLSILDRFAERDGDLDARIALKTKHLSSPYAYLELAELCLSHGREAEALQWAEEGLWQFEDRPDERLISFAAGLYRRSGRAQDAGRILWRCFERSPTLEVYEQLKLTAGDDAGSQAAVIKQAQKTLEARIIASGQTKASPWRSGEANLLIEILMLEERLDAAWQAVDRHGCSDRELEELSASSEATHPARALAAYASLVEHNLEQTAYEQACRFVERVRVIHERQGDADAHASYLADLLDRHKRKRNFVKLLNAQSGGVPRR